MSRACYDRHDAPAEAIHAQSARMPPARLTLLGIGLVALGWAVQLVVGALAPALGRMLGGWAPTQTAVIGVSQSLILSGFGLAILAALHNGFGALNRFFETIAQRSAAAAARASPPPVVTTVPERADPNRINGRGRLGDRSYVQFADGSLEVETLLGSRRFRSFDEARTFVGA